MRRKHDANMDEMEGVAKRLRDERPEASPLELDRIKTTAMSRAKSGSRTRVGSRRLAVAGLTAGLLVATTGGVLAHDHGKGSTGNAANTQYGGECNVSVGSGDSGSHNGNGNEINNCSENTFTEENNTTTITNTTNNNITENTSPVTIVNGSPAVTPTSGVLSSKTGKTATSSKHIKIHVKAPHGLRLRKVTIKVDGKNIKTVYGKKASSIELVGLPCTTTGMTTVTITVKLSNGKTVTSSHEYKLCVS